MASKATSAMKLPVTRSKNWGKSRKVRGLLRPFYALDTERDSETGEFVCGWVVGEGEPQQFELLTDLTRGTYWVYNLAYDIEGMLRDLGEEEGWAAKSDGSWFPLAGGRAIYFHGKRFDWVKGDKRLVFLDASAFNGRRKLETLGTKGAKDWGIDASKMSLGMYRDAAEYPRVRWDSESKSWEETGDTGNYQADVDYYCIRDCEIVYDFICNLDSGMQAGGMSLGSTPGSTARKYLAEQLDFPRVIWNVHRLFLKSYCGGRFEVVKRGVIRDVYQYDIKSAYPAALSKCPWLTETARHESVNRMSDEALYGSYLVDIDLPGYLGVIPQWRKGVRVYSTAERKCWLTRPELEYIHEQGGDYQVIRGVELFDPNATNLWAQMISGLFEMKESGDYSYGPKIILNSLYGILIQLMPKSGNWVPIGEAENPIDFAGTLELEEPPNGFVAGDYYAPVYSATLTAMTRIQLLEAARQVGERAYVGGHTDSVLTRRKMKNGLGSKLGQWELEKQGDAHICKTGMYSIGDSIKVRGITRNGSRDMLWADTHQRKTRAGIRSANSWDEVSVITPKTVENNFAIENKRRWDRPLTKRDIKQGRYVDSKPFELIGA